MTDCKPSTRDKVVEDQQVPQAAEKAKIQTSAGLVCSYYTSCLVKISLPTAATQHHWFQHLSLALFFKLFLWTLFMLAGCPGRSWQPSNGLCHTTIGISLSHSHPVTCLTSVRELEACEWSISWNASCARLSTWTTEGRRDAIAAHEHRTWSHMQKCLTERNGQNWILVILQSW